MTWRGQRIRGRQLGCQDRPTPGLKPKPQGPRPNPSPHGVVAWAFSPNSRSNPSPIPYSLSSGFAFIHPNSIADILAIEAVPLDRIDPAQVKKGLRPCVVVKHYNALTMGRFAPCGVLVSKEAL
ncbi:putative ATP synthase, F1 complex, delta/epsilon subunit [Helianthus debilis subsp. tardiflorus]